MNWLDTLFTFIAELWPFVIVEEWEEGVFYFFGHAWKKRHKPGLYFFIPWFTRMETVSIVAVPFSTPLLNITLKDGKTLGYSATAIVKVVDPWKALNAIEDYQDSVRELVTSMTSTKLAMVPADRLDAEKRTRLITDLLRWLNEDTEQYGVKVLALRFTNFGINQRAYRFLTDTALTDEGWE